MRHYLSVADLNATELEEILRLAETIRSDPSQARLPHRHVVALLFERPSLRTRTASQAALLHLDGRAILHEGPLAEREDLGDVARTLSHLVSAIVARVRNHATLAALVAESEIPVVNALSDREHPVEALADALTLRRHWGDLRGRRLAYVGDGNNICHSLLLLAPLAGMDIAVVGPAGYEPAPEVVEQAQALAAQYGTRVELGHDPCALVQGADAIYTDTWISMGQESEIVRRRQAFAPYQVNADLLSVAAPDAVVLHCLPARRGEEITADVLDGPRSLAFTRLDALIPVQAALLRRLIESSTGA
jgi:ornithine carbamoyltransferase